ncbi:SNF2 family N-terminal domain-containing protein [Mycena rosella]|uniref:SNF2 family N-terminal domain-containing protein n=1 Tax=Mycena rosella TaxID=1033263 RepID=A0AAD7CX67_MYCRO|nr:SNF2 family N-terminal domain-containing protein [Mycena rosella]
MEKPSTQASRVLDALLGAAGAAGASEDASYNTPKRTPFQNANTPNAEAGGSNLKKRARALDIARQAQENSMGQAGPIADASFLSSSLSSSPQIAGGGFQLNYDRDTPIRAIDVGGNDQAERMAEFVTRSIDNLSQGISVKDAMHELGLQDHKDLLPGLEVRLLPHQAIGVAWMLKRERSQDKGGILADDMGLGKTVQMIATMAMNLPAHDEEAGTTLIIVPAALLQQWKDELETKTNDMFSVRLHHGKDKLKKPSEVKDYDVVITTYQTLSMDFHVPKDVDTTEEAQWLSRHGGVLARSRFYRAIADEAQYIRTRSTKASISLAHVRAKYRWMLTGTPVTNTLADLYGLLRFGRFRPYNDWNSFNEHVARVQLEDAPLAGARAQVILKPLLLRRTKNSTLEGKPILTLPPKDVEIVKLKFSDEEREVYDSFEKRTKISLNRFIRNGTLVKNHAAVLVMILRLRQLCCHPYLILSIAEGEGYGDPTLLLGSDTEKERGRAANLMGRPWVDSVKRRFLLRASATELLDDDDEANAPSSNCPVCKDMFLGDNGRVLPCGHEICFDCTLDLSNSPIAHDGVFGEGSEKQNLEMEKEYENAAAKGLRPCPTCHKMTDLTAKKVFKSAAFEPSEEELQQHARSKREAKRPRYNWGDDVKVRVVPQKAFEDRCFDSDSDDDMPDAPLLGALKKEEEEEDSISAGKKGKGKGKASPRGKGKGKTGGEEDDVDMPSAAVLSNWGRGDNDLEPSSKMLAMMDMLKQWDASGDKTICYSQWTSMLDLIEILFSRHGIRSLRFDGKMDRAQRDAVLATFKKSGGPKVILISTKAGSVGLNLVSANRIINMDLSWNAAAEEQAYSRCHRIGQDKDVWVKRLVVENTIEERMLQLQDVKVGLSDAALGEGTGGSLHKMSVKDIKQLFGMAPGPDSPPGRNS